MSNARRTSEMFTTMIALMVLVALARAQVDKDVLQTDYEYQSGQFLDDDDPFLKDYIPVKEKSEQLFLQGLIIEAGRHVLFPKLYESNKVKLVNGEPIKDHDQSRGKVQYYEMKGQPEMEQSYLNEKRSKSGCPLYCPVYKPVCGSDGKVYESKCHMIKENCGSADVTVEDWQKCQGKHYLCPTRCLDLNDPVCGSDGRIYHNICMLRKNNCGKLVDVMPVAKCYENTRQGKSFDECPDRCQDQYKPVCGSDGVIYYNECFMKKRTCHQGIVKMEMESCGVASSKCPEMCLPIYDPVCASDGRRYVNVCRMLQETCGTEIKPVEKSFCQSNKENLQISSEDL